MKYGLIGSPLGHSISPYLQSLYGIGEYSLRELAFDEIGPFLKERSFEGLNVTIPYKEKVLPFLDVLDPLAKDLGAVNTIVNRNGELWGYNTDVYGFDLLYEYATKGQPFRKAAVLGTGGASKAVLAVLQKKAIDEILLVSRTKKSGCITYAELLEDHLDVDLLVNTTPCGMFPQEDTTPVEVSLFKNLAVVLDVVYTPWRTKLVREAQALGVRAYGGLLMLLGQGLASRNLFSGEEMTQEQEREFLSFAIQHLTTVLIVGMPSAGKTTIGKEVSSRLGVPFWDLDALIEKELHMSCRDYLLNFGEPAFREVESRVLKTFLESPRFRLGEKGILSLGGGTLTVEENRELIRANGYVLFLDRKEEDLVTRDTTPLSHTKEQMHRLWVERRPLYLETMDEQVAVSKTVEETVCEVLNILQKHVYALEK